MSFVRGSFGIFACLVLASAFSVPFVIGFVLMDSFTSSYDNSGSGAPFRSCTETSTSCGGPDILGAAVLTVLLSVAVVLPSLVGVAVGSNSVHGQRLEPQPRLSTAPPPHDPSCVMQSRDGWVSIPPNPSSDCRAWSQKSTVRGLTSLPHRSGSSGPEMATAR